MISLKDKNLNIAILVSVFWHFFFMFSFNPVLLTGNIREHRTSISFLGGILESVISGNEKPFVPASVFIKHEIGKSGPVEAEFINALPEKKDFSYSPEDNKDLLKLSVYHKKETAKVDLSDFFIKGDAKDRIIMYKPDLGKVVEMPSDFNSDFSASVGFRISEDGFVKYAECVVSSGSPEIDQAAIRYVRKWQFVPNPKDDQEGIVRVNFE
jgi:TonB family protein